MEIFSEIKNIKWRQKTFTYMKYQIGPAFGPNTICKQVLIDYILVNNIDPNSWLIKYSLVAN